MDEQQGDDSQQAHDSSDEHNEEQSHNEGESHDSAEQQNEGEQHEQAAPEEQAEENNEHADEQSQESEQQEDQPQAENTDDNGEAEGDESPAEDQPSEEPEAPQQSPESESQPEAAEDSLHTDEQSAPEAEQPADEPESGAQSIAVTAHDDSQSEEPAGEPEQPTETEQVPLDPERETEAPATPEVSSPEPETPAESAPEAEQPQVVEPQVIHPTEPAQQEAETPQPEPTTIEPNMPAAPEGETAATPSEVTPEAPATTTPLSDVGSEASAATASVTPAVDEPAAEPVPPSEQAQADQKKGGVFKKLLVMIGLPILILLVLGGAVLGGYYYYQINKPENVLLQAVAHTFDGIARDDEAEVKSFMLDGDITVTTGGEEAFPINIDVTGALDLDGGNNELGVAADFGLFKAGIDLGIFGEEAFVKVSGLELIGGLLLADSPEVAGLLGQINDQWISIENSLIEQTGFSLSETQQLTDDERKKVVESFIDHRFVEFVEELESGDVDGVEAHHYKAKFNTAELKSWIQDMRDINGEALGVNDDLVAMVNDLADAIDAADYDMEIWIGKDDTFIRRITATLRDGETTIDVDLKMSQYNEIATPTKPADAISLGELLLSITPLLESGGLDLGGLLGSSGLAPTPTAPDEGALESNSLLQQTADSEFPSFTLGETDTQ